MKKTVKIVWRVMRTVGKVTTWLMTEKSWKSLISDIRDIWTE